MAEKRIVIAEDEAIPRLGLREMLEDQGYVVVGEASDGRAAVDVARELRPDLVIMDIMMPEMDGITATRLLAEERVAPVLLVMNLVRIVTLYVANSSFPDTFETMHKGVWPAFFILLAALLWFVWVNWAVPAARPQPST